MRSDAPIEKHDMSEKIVRYISVLTVGMLVLVGGFTLFIFFLFAWPDTETVAQYDLGSGIELEFLAESDWDTGDGLYYQTSKDGNIITSKTFITLRPREKSFEANIVHDDEKDVINFKARGVDSDDIWLQIDANTGEAIANPLNILQR